MSAGSCQSGVRASRRNIRVEQRLMGSDGKKNQTEKQSRDARSQPLSPAGLPGRSGPLLPGRRAGACGEAH